MPRSSNPTGGASIPELPPPPAPPPADPTVPFNAGGAQTTGRYLVVYSDAALNAPDVAMESLSMVAGIRNVASSRDYDDGALDLNDSRGADAQYFPALGVAVVSADDAQLQSLSAAAADESSPVLAIEPEYVYYALTDLLQMPRPYVEGYRDAVIHLTGKLISGESAEGLEIAAALQDTAQLTWGLQATRVNTSPFTGKGVKVAVLDTGMDLQHPDFVGRPFIRKSFIPGQTEQDGQGHGTHCIGTACGPLKPATAVRRYGCAHGSNIFVGKVLSNSGSSVGSSVLAGMDWAITQRCHVISMSLGGGINQVSEAFEQAGRRALDAGCLIVAAAGNNANRAGGSFGFVSQPANSRSIMAVAAVDSQLRVANFSARSSAVTGVGGKVDISGPGVGVFSSWPRPALHNTISGTSMATPHVAGIAAQWCQATGRTGMALWTTLIQNARQIGGDGRDIGAGLVQAPQ
ncbi:MAG TPA: S8 family serine peptidase [Longimicrobium sp.]|nr:S8 family serine peptidase [Longimicrobium sp.]